MHLRLLNFTHSQIFSGFFVVFYLTGSPRSRGISDRYLFFFFSLYLSIRSRDISQLQAQNGAPVVRRADSDSVSDSSSITSTASETVVSMNGIKSYYGKPDQEVALGSIQGCTGALLFSNYQDRKIGGVHTKAAKFFNFAGKLKAATDNPIAEIKIVSGNHSALHTAEDHEASRQLGPVKLEINRAMRTLYDRDRLKIPNANPPMAKKLAAHTRNYSRMRKSQSTCTLTMEKKDLIYGVLEQ